MSGASESTITEDQKTSYIQCIINAATEVNSLTHEITKELQIIIERAENKVKVVDDAQDTSDKTLNILENIEINVNQIKKQFLDSYNFWLQKCIDDACAKNNSYKSSLSNCSKDVVSEEESIITKINQNKNVHNSSDSELEIVNEIKYLSAPKIVDDRDKDLSDKYSHNNSNFQKNDDEINIKSNEPLPVNNGSFLTANKNVMVKLHVNNILLDDTFKSAVSDLENNYYLLDKKLSAKCIVVLERLSEKELQKYKRLRSKSKQKLHNEDKEFNRLIDLSTVCRRNKKLCSSSDDSSRSSSKSLIPAKKFQKNIQKTADDSSESEASSFYGTTDDEDSTSDNVNKDNEDNVNSDDSLTKIICRQNEEICKQRLLNDIDSSENDSTEDEEISSEENKKKKRKRIQNNSYSSSNSEEENKNRRKSWLNDKLLQERFSDFDSKDSNMSRIRRKKRRKILRDSDSNTSKDKSDILTCSSSDSCQLINDDLQKSEDCQILSDDECQITNGDFLESSSKITSKSSGRRNIRKVFDDQEVTEVTRQAAKNEESRLQRLAERTKSLHPLINAIDQNKYLLVLDYDIVTKEALVTVDNGLVKHLKPHQENGIKFMWDSCFESLELAQITEGSGAILAHSMGLGKTFQVITLVHTLLTHKSVGINTVLILCPMNTVLNWIDEFDMWLKNVENKTYIPIFQLTQVKIPKQRIKILKSWNEKGGVLILSYDMFRSLTFGKKLTEKLIKEMNSYLLNPGADLIVCDEGHLLKNENSLLVEQMHEVRTKRRIILTGTPLQNNLIEYHCMVQFVKPNLLGTKTEFRNRFVNPITNGQFDDSTPSDVKLMKHRAHVLHKMLEGSVQRVDYTVLTPFLPPKQEYVISIRLSDLQIKMYQHYLDDVIKHNVDKSWSSMFKVCNELKRLIVHPYVLYLTARLNKKNINKTSQIVEDNLQQFKDFWWFNFIKNENLEDLSISSKLMLLFSILEKCEKEGDKLLVFSQSLQVLDTIQKFLQKIDESKTKDDGTQMLFNFQGEWKPGVDFLRLDGQVTSEKRNIACKTFNNMNNRRARLFLISTKAGGLGINLIGANRVVIFDPSWNPSHDVQSIFRIFRFGQKKPCYIYRFLGAGTMEEKIYNRQVTKLSLALRVVDEQQIKRHYSLSDLAELFKFDPLIDKAPTLNLPRDHVLADVFLKYKNYVYNCFEHDSLLENKEEEELDEDERIQAWFDYEKEKELNHDVNKFKNKNKK